MIIKIKNLSVHTVIGLQPWEREQKQQVLINLELELADESASWTDEIDDSVDYKQLKCEILDKARQTSFFLLERLAGFVLDIVMKHEKVARAAVEIDKPGALRFADSVSVCLTRKR